MHALLQKHLFRYLIAGGSAFCTEYAAFYALYAIVGLQVGIATSISFAVGLLTSFVANRIFTFSKGSYSSNAKQQGAYFIILAMINLGIINTLVPALRHFGIDPKIGKLISMILLPIWNYFIFKHFIFKHEPTE